MERQESTETCPVCHEIIGVHSIGVCDHPICFRCSMRMRSLCEQFYCAICRTDLPKVYLMRKRVLFKDLDKTRRYIENRKLQVCYEDESVRQDVEKVLENKCKLCRDRPADRTFRALRDHMRKSHTLYFCDLCVDGLKIFTHERKCYSRQLLASHRRLGDKDDTSYKGHPLCQFCDERYMDNEALWRHLRKDHYYCHFCDADGSNDYYGEYEDLKLHFRRKHYLCEEDDCVDEKFTHAFRSKIDLQAHVAQSHNRSMSKAQSRQARTLDVDFQFAPRGRHDRGMSNNMPKGRGRDRGQVTRDDFSVEPREKRPHQFRGSGPKSSQFNNFRPEEVHKAIQASLQTMKNEDMKKGDPKVESSSDEELLQNEENFPTLGGMTSRAPIQPGRHSPTETHEHSLANKLARSHGKSVQHSQMNEEMFPTLSDPNSPSLERKSVHKKTVPGKRTDPPEGGYSDIIRHGNIMADGDFPELQSKQKSSVSNKVSSTQWTNPNHIQNPITKFPKNTKTDTSITHKIVPLSKKSKLEESKPSLTKLGKVLKDDNEFPSLGGTSTNSLVPAGNAQWLKKNNNNKSPVTNGSVVEPTRKHNLTENTLLKKEPDIFIKSNDKKKKNKTNKKESKTQFTERKTLDSIATLLLQSNIDGRECDSSPVEDLPISRTDQKSLSKDSKDEIRPYLQKCDEALQRVVKKDQSRSNIPDIEKTEIVVVEAKQKLISNKNAFDSDTKKQIRPQMPKFQVDDFPELPTTQVKKQSSAPPPPGFTKPPPGFVTKNNNRPPPGFTNPNKEESKSENVSTPLGITMEYSKPNDFQNRNQQLIKDIANTLGSRDGCFDEFKSFSGEFRRGHISASEYYQRCRSLLGENTFENVFPELLALLPDIDKQQQLLTIHSAYRDELEENIVKLGNNMRAGWKLPANLKSCPTCQQVVVSHDLDNHMECHFQEAEFPSLNSCWSQNLKCNAWIKAT
ncbi:hypothetical protein ScPMuIL_004264 [Solemya velum]